MNELARMFPGEFPHVLIEAEQHGFPCLVMPLYKATLSRLKKNHEFTLPQSISYAIDCVQALRKFHSAGFVHCDLKPDNIMVNAEGEIRIIDFGLAHSYLTKEGKHIPY